MKPREFVAIVPSSALLDPAEFLLFTASHAHELRTEDGRRLNDLLDVTAWMLEVSRALRGWNQPAPGAPLNASCPDCGHEHGEEKECGFAIGGGRVCRCERKVPA